MRMLTCIAALIATAIATGYGHYPGRASSGQGGDAIYVVVYGPRISDHGGAGMLGVAEKTAALEASAGFKSILRYRGAIQGFAADLSPQALERVRSDADVVAAQPSPGEFVVTYPHATITREVRAKIRSDARRLRFYARLEFLRTPLYGFAARLSARQIGSLARDPSTFTIRPDPFAYTVRGPSRERAIALSRELGFTPRSIGVNGFSAELTAPQLRELGVQPDVRLIDPVGVAVVIDPMESTPYHLVFFPTRPQRYAAALRAAFLKAHPRLSRAEVRGPLGRISAATYRKREYALAIMSVRRIGTRGQPELFIRPAGGRWRDVRATAGKICTNLVPLMVIRAWGLTALRKGGRQVSSDCYQP